MTGRIRAIALGVALLCAALVTSPVLADPTFHEATSRDFIPTPGLQGKVEFWVRVFTKYGKDQMVVHFRDHPEIVYSILDFSDLTASFSGRQLEQAKGRAIQEETDRIDAALKWLGQGNPARNELESRIVRIFQGVLGKDTANFRKAREPDQIRTQTGIRERFQEGVKRSGRYLYAIERIFQQAGLPWELTRVPYVESSYDYTAYSSVGAAGIWQFMPGTARNYMRVTSSIDERRDPIVATRAATHYLEHAFSVLGRWPLAVTSYNHGITGVLRGVKTVGSSELDDVINRYDSDSFGFASKNFYASFLAALEVDRNWRNYFPGLDKDPPWYFDEVRLDRPMYLREAARFAEMSSDDLAEHNLAFLKPIVQNRVQIPAGYLLKVPQGRGVNFAQRVPNATQMLSLENASDEFSKTIKKQPDERTLLSVQSGDTYVVQKGDTLGAIAVKRNVLMARLMAVNGIQDPRKIRIGMKLRIPSGTGEPEAKSSPTAPKNGKTIEKGTVSENKKEASSAEPKTYIVSTGDNLSKIAKKNATTVKALQGANPGLKEKVLIGQKLTLP